MSIVFSTSARSAHSSSLAWWRRCEAPTLALCAVHALAWAALVIWHAALPGWLLFALGGYLAQMHMSLQHESIHALRGLPRWLRRALVWLPINLWLPYELYRRSHSAHHVNFHLTHPQKDTESAYHSAEAWAAYPALQRALYLANQTLAVRLVVGPLLCVWHLVRGELARLRAGDASHAAVWVRHALGVLAVLTFVQQIGGLSLGEYLLYFVYPGMMLGALRSFTEHRWSDGPHERVAIVESNLPMGLVFLFNNLHHVHHRAPTMPWYEIPVYFRRHRAELLADNGQFYFRGYAQIARRHLLRPVFEPVHPQW